MGGNVVPVIFLDTDVSEDTAYDRSLTHYPYGGGRARRHTPRFLWFTSKPLCARVPDNARLN